MNRIRTNPRFLGWFIPALAHSTDARALIGEKTAPRVLLIGSGPTARQLVPFLAQRGWELVGHVAENMDGASNESVGAPLGNLENLREVVSDFRPDRVIITEEPARVWPLLDRCELDERCEVYIVPGPYELALCPPGALRLGDVALFRLPGRDCTQRYWVAKRALDLACALFLLLVFGPILLVAMALIKLTSPGGAIFSQERIGRDGRRIKIFKLRTMVVDAEKDGPQFCGGMGDPRLTPVGRWLRKLHLDELPQLWNVLRGEMSLVGPRPERPEFVEQFEQELPEYAERHRVLPGITGLAQVYGTYHSSPREKLRYDLMYLYHSSPVLDVWVLLRTLWSVVR